MSQWSSSAVLVVALMAAEAGLAQMASRNQKVDVMRVGSRIACQCGCPDTVATCSMYGCWSHKAKQLIAQKQAAGVSDAAIVDDFIKEYGRDIYRGAPNQLGWVIPYGMLALGAVFVMWFVRRAQRPEPIDR